MTSEGAELAPHRKEVWRGAGEVLFFVGLGELSCDMVVTFLAVLSPLEEIPWRRFLDGTRRM